jgi:DNA topoisomerase-1
MRGPVTPAPAPSPDAIAAVESAGLRYVTDTQPGIRRTGAPKTFRYRRADGRAVTDTAALGRIKRLAIPPAWTDVWICPHANGHIQATGRDARGRKQYRYHSDWRAARDDNKYARMIAFGRALPRIRRRVARAIAQPGLGREKILATMVRLLETTLVRVGNEEYARQNGSFGLSTMHDRHARIRGDTVRFEFRGKSGVRHRITLRDRRLARIVRRAQELPGQELFQYVDEDGRVQDVKSEDVNAYLREIAGAEFTAKDFRTWAGTVLAALALRQFEQFSTKAEAKRNLVRAIESVAQRLGNTPAVCRKCYIHPVVLDSYLDGATIDVLRDRAEQALGHGLGRLSGPEGAVLAFLQQRLRRRKQRPLLTALRQSLRPRRAPRRPRVRDTSDGAVATTRSRRRKSRISDYRPRRGSTAGGASGRSRGHPAGS